MSLYDRFRSSRESHYVTESFYDAVLARRTAARRLGLSEDQSLRNEAEAFLYYEARLIDEARYEEWLDLYAENCLYWVPTDDEADPRTSVNIAFDDRRRLEDRVIRLRTGFAHNQAPERLLHHQISNVEAWADEGGAARRVLACQIVFEHRSRHPLVTHICRTDHRLIQERGGWRIAEKRVVLLNRKEGLETPTIL